MSKTCLINQPMGLGDILWEQAIVDHYINEGYEVVFPVDDTYYEMVARSIVKPGLSWYKTTDEFPLYYVYNNEKPMHAGNVVYLPLRYADKYVNAPLMLGKYVYAQLPVPDDYRNNFDIIRDVDREAKLIQTYGITTDTIIINECFGPPGSPIRHAISLDTSSPVHYMSAADDIKNGFCLFDWIGALQLAKAIHTVGTSICYIIDKYCDNDMHIYERRGEGWPRTFHKEVEGVYKNPRWSYES